MVIVFLNDNFVRAAVTYVMNSNIHLPAEALASELIDLFEPLEVVIVPPGHVWLSGDNPRNSLDSRMYGPVSLEMMLGKVTKKLFDSQTNTLFRDLKKVELGPEHPKLVVVYK